MAKIDWVNFGGHRQRCVNLTASVGKGGRNLWRDVMLIQALFAYLHNSRHAAALHLPKNFFQSLGTALGAGNMNVATLHTIRDFQTINRKHLLSADGNIEPAKYAGRVIEGNPMTQPLMTITYLHVLAKRVESSAETKMIDKAAHSGRDSITGKVSGAVIGGTIALLTAGVDYIDKLNRIAPDLHLH